MCDFLDLIDFVEIFMYPIRGDMPTVAKAFYFLEQFGLILFDVSANLQSPHLRWNCQSLCLLNDCLCSRIYFNDCFHHLRFKMKVIFMLENMLHLFIIGCLFTSFTILVVSSSKSYD